MRQEVGKRREKQVRETRVRARMGTTRRMLSIVRQMMLNLEVEEADRKKEREKKADEGKTYLQMEVGSEENSSDLY